MGVFKKLKDVLFDDIEDEIPVITKKEEVQEKPKRIEKEIIPENTIKEIKIPKEEVSEREIIKSESTFNFPMDFDEKPLSRSNRVLDFEEPQPVKRKDETRDFTNFLKESVPKETANQFKPTPIISPVYGILDQNYSKDDVIIKTDIGVKGPNLDEVRKRAYGIEPKKEPIKKTVPKKEIPELVENESPDPIQTLDEILMNEDTYEIELKKPKLEEIVPPILKEEKFTEETKEVDIDDTLETDLFNLIDSMYEDREEREEE